MRKVAIVLIVILAAAGLLFLRMKTPPGTGRSIEFTIKPGWGVRKVAEAMEDSSLVRSRWFVLLRYKLAFEGSALQAGRYLVSDTMSTDSMLGMFSRGDVIPVPTSWVTLPPGLRMEESISVLAESLNLSEDELYALSEEIEYLDAMGIPCFEGYLFPETYEFADTLMAYQVINRIVASGQQIMNQEWKTDCEALGLTPFQGVILASIVEREAASDAERAQVAGVFINRLRIGMRLESCATVQYALGEVHQQLLYSDLEIESPYNTYRNQGLPPAPICSPGTASLMAVAEPDTAEGYLFFVSREDGSGLHLFARTASEHNRNIRSVRQ
ncbi:hypothetical protein CSA37_13080 [Candidatus Fermentibacteria bacterium]|nr:MAG: hypothetical protein CSA37_13080 [Candidatus Fermentibacteria bacterium]